MKSLGGETNQFGKIIAEPTNGPVSPTPDYELLFDDTGIIAVADRMVLPPVLCTDTFLEFYAYIPNDGIGAETLFSLAGVGSIPRFYFKFKPSTGIIQMQGKTDLNVDIDEDTPAYTHFDEYAKLKVDFSGTSLRLYVNDALFHTFNHGDSITSSLFINNFVGALDNNGNQPMRLGGKLKLTTGIFGQSLAFKDNFHNTLCDEGDTAAFVFDNKNGSLWSQSTVACRPVVHIL